MYIKKKIAMKSTVRELREERKKIYVKMYIVKHTTKKFKMSDFCFFYFYQKKTKTFSYDSIYVRLDLASQK